MQKKQKKTSPKRILAATAALVVAFLLLASVIGLAEKYFAIRNRVKSLNAEHQEIVQKKEALENKNNYTATTEGQERELRSKYNVVKPGEGMIVITEPTGNKVETRPDSAVGRWWDSLLKGVGLRKE